MVVPPGIAAIPLLPGLTKGDLVYPSLIFMLLPPGFTGAVAAVFLEQYVVEPAAATLAGP